MEKISFTGKCPQCELYNEESLMRENKKNWECPNCNLMILIENDNASIFRHRGEGNFKLNLNKFSGEIKYQEVDDDSYPNGREILDTNHLIKYLLLQVNQNEKYSITNLIDCYVDYKFNEENEDQYIQQSTHFSINFDDESITGKLKQRDLDKNLSNEYSTERLYNFLSDNIFPKYRNSDNSWLPEMGMSKLQMYICKKHFSKEKSKIINSNPIFIKQQLKELIKDLIDIIYFDKKVLLTFDLKVAENINSEMYSS